MSPKTEEKIDEKQLALPASPARLDRGCGPRVNGTFPCSGIDSGSQYGNYEGLVSFNGVSHPVWTDSRRQLQPSTGCATNLLMEEVFTATIK